MKTIEETAARLCKEIDTPFYIFDEKGFVNNYNLLEKTFKSIYPDYQISYSYKTNYTPYICNLVKKLGGYAEVVSDMEYTLAKKLGYDNPHIVYNGPSKGPLAFEHLEKNGIINVDSLDEMHNIAKYCNSKPEKIYSCGLRINMDLGDDFISRFGLSTSNDDIDKAVKLVKSVPNLNLVGLHCHISRHRSLDAWRKRAEIMLDLADRYIDGIPEYISLGSGMYADMPDFLKNQFGGKEVPTYSDYAEAVISPFAKHYKDSVRKPVLFTEPGTTVVARYLNFVSKVLSIKEIRGRHIANMDGDYHNLGEICTMKKLPVIVLPGGEEQHIFPNLDIMGFTCLEQDLMYPGFDRSLAKDDILIFNNVGGYSIVSKPQFIKPQCAMFALKSDNSVEEIMRSETFEDIFSKFKFDF